MNASRSALVLFAALGVLLAAGCSSQPADNPGVPAENVYSYPFSEESLPPDPPLPIPEDFELNLKVTSKKCFGSAGCIVEFSIDPTYIGQQDLQFYYGPITVTYEVTGTEDKFIDSFTVNGDVINYNPEGFVDTPDESVELDVQILEVY